MPSGFVTSSLNGTVVNGDNLNFGTLATNVGEMNAAGKIPIATGVAYPGVQIVCNTLTAGPGISITNGPGTIQIGLTGGGLAFDEINVQAFTAPGTNPVLPSGTGALTLNGAAVAAQLIPVRSNSLAANTLQLEVQRASASAATNATQQGLSSFNSAHFSVDANGWVSSLNGLPASAFDVQANTAPGTDPVVPNASGVVQVNGSIVAAHAIPLRTNSLAANAYNIEAQYSSAQAVDTPTASGMCHFNSAQFTVSATGFVSALGGTAPWLDSAGGALANHTGYFATAAAVYTLPAGVANGDMVEIVDFIGGGVVVTAQGGDLIRISNTDSSVNGTATSTQIGDALRLVFRAVGQVWVCVPGAAGNWILA